MVGVGGVDIAAEQEPGDEGAERLPPSPIELVEAASLKRSTNERWRAIMSISRISWIAIALRSSQSARPKRSKAPPIGCECINGRFGRQKSDDVNRRPYLRTGDRICHVAVREAAFTWRFWTSYPIPKSQLPLNDTLKRAMTLMTHHRVRHLPVIPTAISSASRIGDIVKHQTGQIWKLKSNVSGRVHSGALKRWGSAHGRAAAVPLSR